MLLSRFYKKFWLGNKRKGYIAILESKREQKIPLHRTKCLIATTKNLRETQFCFAWRDKTMSFSFELVRTELQTEEHLSIVPFYKSHFINTWNNRNIHSFIPSFTHIFNNTPWAKQHPGNILGNTTVKRSRSLPSRSFYSSGKGRWIKYKETK